MFIDALKYIFPLSTGSGCASTSRLSTILAGMTQVAEGVKSASVVMKLAADYGIDMPIAREVDAVVNSGASVEQAYRGLLAIPPGHEVHGDSW